MIDAQFSCAKCGGAVKVVTVDLEEKLGFWKKFLHRLLMDKQTKQVHYAVCQVCGRKKRLK